MADVRGEEKEREGGNSMVIQHFAPWHNMLPGAEIKPFDHRPNTLTTGANNYTHTHTVATVLSFFNQYLIV